MVWDATSLPRMAASCWPVVPRRTRITTTAHTANTAVTSRKKDRLAVKSTGPMRGRGTASPDWPLPAHRWGKTMLSAMRPKAKVARAR